MVGHTVTLQGRSVNRPCLDLDRVDDNGGSSHGGPGAQATHAEGGTALDAPRGGT